MTYIDINKIGFNANEWISSLDFYQEDLDILGNRLEEVATKNTHEEVLSEVEHFQNQFQIQKVNIGDYKHRLRTHAHLCSEDVKSHAGKVNTSLKNEQTLLDLDLKTFENRLNELRSEFKQFLLKRM